MRTTSPTSAVEPRIKMVYRRKQKQSCPVTRYRSTLNVVRTVQSWNVWKYPIIRPIFELETSRIEVKPLFCRCQTIRLLEFQVDSCLSRQCVRIESVAGHSFAIRGGVWGWQVGRPPQAPLLRGPRASGLWVCQAIFSGKLEMLIHASFKILLQSQIP